VSVGWWLRGPRGGAGPRDCAGPSLHRQGCCASLRDGPGGPPLTAEPLGPLIGQEGQAGACPGCSRGPAPLASWRRRGRGVGQVSSVVAVGTRPRSRSLSR
jgi:hypothetical protein